MVNSLSFCVITATHAKFLLVILDSGLGFALGAFRRGVTITFMFPYVAVLGLKVRLVFYSHM